MKVKNHPTQGDTLLFNKYRFGALSIPGGLQPIFIVIRENTEGDPGRLYGFQIILVDKENARDRNNNKQYN